MKDNRKKKISLMLVIALTLGLFVGCSNDGGSADETQTSQTQTLMSQANNKLGMPNIKNFYEKQMMKTIMEDCDNSNLITYAYIKNDMTGKFTYLGEAMGYGLPYGTEYTNPQRQIDNGYHDSPTIPQPDPNGLFKPADVNATWLMLIDPVSKQAHPVYVESDLTVSPFKLPKNLLDLSTLPANY